MGAERNDRSKLLILGSGFAAVSLMRGIDQRLYDDLEHYKGKGWTAWLFWRSAYLTRLLSIRSKFQVAVDWVKSHIFGRDISRF